MNTQLEPGINHFSDLLKRKVVSRTLLAAMALPAISACGTAEDPVAPTDTQQSDVSEFDSFGVHHLYTKDGKRITTYGGDVDIDTTYAYCDSGDLVELPDSSNHGISVISRSPLHPACDDGKLTASDFPKPLQ